MAKIQDREGIPTDQQHLVITGYIQQMSATNGANHTAAKKVAHAQTKTRVGGESFGMFPTRQITIP